MDSPLYIVRYTAAELLGLTILKLFPTALLISGGVNEFGFYYDFTVETPLDESFIVMLEETMRRSAKENHEIISREMMRENAVDFFLHLRQPLKAESIESTPYNIVRLVEISGFFDLAPPYIAESTGCVSFFKIYDLEEIVYPTEQGGVAAFRLTGDVFNDKQELKRFVKQLKEGKNSCNELIEAMELFDFNESVSDLQCSWLPKGTAMLEAMLSLRHKAMQSLSVLPVKTPSLIDSSLFQKNEMSSAQEVSFEVRSENANYRAMQDPAAAHASLFSAKARQITEMPVRYSETKEVYAGGMIATRLAGILKSPAHLADFIHSFCAPEQLRGELISSLQFIKKLGTILGLRCQWKLCCRKGKSPVRQKTGDRAIALIREVLTEAECDYTEDFLESCEFGPSLQGDYVDRFGRKWEGPKITVDFQLPVHLGLCYTDHEGRKITPVLVRISTLGPLERLIALLVEKDDGMLPLRLAPEQVRVIAVDDAQIPYANSVLQKVIEAGFRASGDLRSKSLGSSLGMKIHEFENAKVPYALIVGNSEERENRVNVRKCGDKAMSLKMDIDSFLQKLLREPEFFVPGAKSTLLP